MPHNVLGDRDEAAIQYDIGEIDEAPITYCIH